MRHPLHWSARYPAIRTASLHHHLLTQRYLGVVVIISLGWFASAPATSIAAEDADTQSSQVFQETVRPLLVRYCSGCHGEDTQEADIALTSYSSPQSARADRETWMAVDEAVLFGSMPPEDEPQPTRDERKLISSWIQSLFAVDCTNDRDPGRETIRRLNRAEYDNTIRDLLGLDLNLAEDFPSDDVGEGFDNIGDVLSLPPLLLEKYMQAAETAAAAAIVLDAADRRTQRREREQLKPFGSARLADYGVYSISSSGGVAGEFDFPRDGQYRIRIAAGAQQAGSEVARMLIRLGDQDVETRDVPAPRDRLDTYEIDVRVPKRGKQRISAAFINDFYDPQAKDPRQRDRNLYVESIEVVGPTDVRAGDLPESHRRIFVTTPKAAGSAEKAARKILETFATRAFRRPVTADELERLVDLANAAVARGESFERSIQIAVTAVLVSPHFLFRVELDPHPEDPQQVRRLNDFEVATRLSYFLWSTMPDAELFDLATNGKLQRQDVLRQQVRRMLQDPKAAALVENFASQWLNLRTLDEITPDPESFGSFDEPLREAMRHETEMLFETVMREDRSIVEFLTADYTFLNERLARHYGIEGVRGDRFRRVALSDVPRVGLLTQASILTLTSNPTRTSPVKRGKWILENVLGTPPPEPPANVPPLETTQEASPNATVREQLVMHRENPVCASCHLQMDDLGFGFENFDAIGQWRDQERGRPIDSTGELPGGEKFSGAAELVEILARRKQQFADALTRRMLTYALGRGLQPADRCAVEDIVKRLGAEDYRFSELVQGIVESEPFRMRRGEGDRS